MRFELEQLQQRGEPLAGVDVEQTRAGSHRAAYGRRAGETLLKEFSERNPARNLFEQLGLRSTQPAQAGRPVGPVQYAAGAGMHLARIEVRAQSGHLAPGPPVEPWKQRCYRLAARIDAEQTVPER